MAIVQHRSNTHVQFREKGKKKHIVIKRREYVRKYQGSSQVHDDFTRHLEEVTLYHSEHVILSVFVAHPVDIYIYKHVYDRLVYILYLPRVHAVINTSYRSNIILICVYTFIC